MSAGPSITVWTLGEGSRGEWTVELTTADIDEAEALYAKLEGEGRQVALSELGLFEHEGRQVTGEVNFWWSANLYGYMEMEPVKRGEGWADDVAAWVAYRSPEPTADAPIWKRPASVPAVAANSATGEHRAGEARERYVEVACDRCGRILPKYLLKQFTHDVKSGRTSGTTRSSQSTGSRASGKSFSSTTRQGSSSTSGRTYYRTETLLLCEACHADYVKTNRSIFSSLLDVLARSLKS